MFAYGLVTNNINYGSLYPSLSQVAITSLTQSFSYGDELSFTCSLGGGYDYAFNGWFVVDVNNSTYHRQNRLPLYCQNGAQWTHKMSLRMNYTSSVVVIAELT
jgi:hypothetical protein